MFQEELTPIRLKLFQTMEREAILPNSCDEATITVIPKPDIDKIAKENYRPLSLMNRDAKIIHKLLFNRIQQYVRQITHLD